MIITEFIVRSDASFDLPCTVLVSSAKVGEVKDKVSKIKVPELGKRNTDNERYMGILGVREDDIFNFLKKRQGKLMNLVVKS